MCQCALVKHFGPSRKLEKCYGSVCTIDKLGVTETPLQSSATIHE